MRWEFENNDFGVLIGKNYFVCFIFCQIYFNFYGEFLNNLRENLMMNNKYKGNL